MLKLDNLIKFKSLELDINRVHLTFTKKGNIIILTSSHQGGWEDAELAADTIPNEFKPAVSTYLTVACVSGSPQLILYPNGSVKIAKNGAVIQEKTIYTVYYSAGSYIGTY